VLVGIERRLRRPGHHRPHGSRQPRDVACEA
jgi:hypothetical protein